MGRNGLQELTRDKLCIGVGYGRRYSRGGLETYDSVPPSSE